MVTVLFRLVIIPYGGLFPVRVPSVFSVLKESVKDRLMSSILNSAHRSISPFEDGVPVSPMTRLALALTFISDLNLFAWWFLKDESSSTTMQSNGNPRPLFSMSHWTFSRLMIVMSAPFCTASALSFGVPTATAYVRYDRWSHFFNSSGHANSL